jgi:uncharacterized iron-regulated membrane protein
MNASTTANSSRWFRFNLWLHRWTSLIATIPFLILCITGTVLIFHEEIDEALGVVPQSSATGEMPLRSLTESIANVLAVYPEERVLSVGIDPTDHPGMLLVVTADKAARNFEGAHVRYADLATGGPVGQPDQGMTFTGFLLELHAQWFLGLVGELVGALIALLVFLSLLSGLVVYAPYVRRVAFGVLRRGRGPRLLQLDLHNLIGAVVLGWACVVTLTGFLLGFGTVAIGLWQITELKPFLEQAQLMDLVDVVAPPVDIDRAFAAAQSVAGDDWVIGSMIYPGTNFSTPRHYIALLGGTEGLEERLFSIAAIDAMTGEVALTREPPLYLNAISLSEPLHFGDYGGLPLKLLWTACTWLTLFITANGAWLWWDRRRGRRARANDVATTGAVA